MTFVTFLMKQSASITASRSIIVLTIFILNVSLTACSGNRDSREAVNVEATVAAGVAATQQAEAQLQATIEAAVAATQAAAATPTPSSVPEAEATPTQVQLNPETAAEQVRTVIMNEVNSAITQDLASLKSLYAANAVLIDHYNTPNDPNDNLIWQGWSDIEKRYLEFFSAGHTSLSLVDLTIEINGNQAIARHQGVILDGTFYEDRVIYVLENFDGQWLITQLEYSTIERANEALAGNESNGDQANNNIENHVGRDDGLYSLVLGNQHRYEEPWGWDRGDPCEAWRTGNFDDTKPDFRGFNVELLLTNNSTVKVPDTWPISFTTARGKPAPACYYSYEGSGPPPGATSSVTFFTVVEKGDYVQTITFELNDQVVRICLDGQGGWSRC